MKETDLIYAHQLCESNRQKLMAAKVCGCFYCLHIFDPEEIVWEDDADNTAMCPYCGIDSILPESATLPITKSFLRKMREYWFSESE
jgi:hypothetical protein